jgi:hypothetical protein
LLQERFSQNFLARECRNSKESNDPEAEQIGAVRATFHASYSILVQAFTFYSVSVLAIPFFMGLNEFTAFLDVCKIPDNETPGIKRSDLDTIFIVCTRKVWDRIMSAWVQRGTVAWQRIFLCCAPNLVFTRDSTTACIHRPTCARRSGQPR